MKKFLLFVTAFFNLYALAAHVSADTQLQAGIGKTDMSYKEFLRDGSKFNREDGWLNTLYLGAASDLYNNIDWILTFERSSGAVAYTGQSQSGTPSDTTTDEHFRTLLSGIRWQPGAGSWSLLLNYGVADWQRGIRPNGITGELDEYYRWRILQAATAWQGELSGHLIRFEFGYTRRMDGNIEVNFRPYGGRKGNAELADGHSFYTDLSLPLFTTSVGDILLSWRYSKERAAESDKGNAGTLEFIQPRSRVVNSRFMLLWQFSF
ncbi:hypothetical protein [Thalassolituus pacificus]|jgi:hypothetical protein|uniref:YaiO family outer membrane beta-barrel protein n=1 Tax=Thalassolituus pacificus TaxID=2975440 RepID=A0A9X2WD95_9GAMM|nr:hypothetical protein [Thalassolituus pacificus]MCT7358016.1 hypothetical protein [Thalassolituus pacificus]